MFHLVVIQQARYKCTVLEETMGVRQLPGDTFAVSSNVTNMACSHGNDGASFQGIDSWRGS